jgi:hypothetical protein
MVKDFWLDPNTAKMQSDMASKTQNAIRYGIKNSKFNQIWHQKLKMQSDMASKTQNAIRYGFKTQNAIRYGIKNSKC